MAVGKKPTAQLRCNGCTRETIHTLQHRHQVSGTGSGEYADERWWATYDLYECRGCRDVTLLVSSQSTDDGSDRPHVEYFPPRISRHPPRWLYEIEDADLFGLFQEVYAALHADAKRLAMMGCRAILDRVMVKAVTDVGAFEKKLDLMVTRQLLSKPDRDVLHAAIDAGSASSHRGYLPTPNVLEHVVTIVEHAVHATLLERVAKEIKKKTPKRPKR